MIVTEFIKEIGIMIWDNKMDLKNLVMETFILDNII